MRQLGYIPSRFIVGEVVSYPRVYWWSFWLIPVLSRGRILEVHDAYKPNPCLCWCYKMEGESRWCTEGYLLDFNPRPRRTNMSVSDHLGDDCGNPSEEDWKRRMSQRVVTREEFDRACEALWSEIEYQNNLPIRTADEAKDVPGFLTLLRRYVRKTEDAWADNPAVLQVDGEVQVPEALHGLRKLAGICVRAMVYNGVRKR